MKDESARRANSLDRDPSQIVSQRDLRSLVALGDTASTCRVLNLGRIYLDCHNDKEYALKPFFRHRQMNKCIMIKHTLRSNERGMLPHGRRTATKLVFPFDPADLRLGGQSVFVGEYGFDGFLRHFYDARDVHELRDVQILRALDSLPSLDPFIVREYLGRHGFKPAACYLQISPADVVKMLGFCNLEIEDLVRRALGVTVKGGALNLAGKILASDMNNDLEPLRRTLRIEEERFSEGLFAWRGFLYFKWRWTELQKDLRKVLDSLAAYVPRGIIDQEHKIYLNNIRPRIGYKVLQGIKQCGQLLLIYDTAYKALVEAANPTPFRNFLMDGPRMFYDLGEIIGILDHISSFWHYRMVTRSGFSSLPYQEYADLLTDFEESLSVVYDDQKDGRRY
jgi:hypothetical protein